jgi:hypothetical protein
MKDLEVKQLAKSIAAGEHTNVAGNRFEAARLPAAQHELFVKEYRETKESLGANTRTIDVRVSEMRKVWRYLSSDVGKKDEAKAWGKLKSNADTWAKANDPNASLDVEGQRFKSFEATCTKLAEEAERFGPIALVRFALVILKDAKHEDKTLQSLIDAGVQSLGDCVDRANDSAKVTTERGIRMAA